tara:strand:- start:1647 stop:1841 length:195 start_codon:yes stop_codon:yes gene_type:complete
MKKATAEASLDIYVNCPHCGEYQDVTGDLIECLDNELKATDLDEEITCCYNRCGKTFIVEEITY